MKPRALVLHAAGTNRDPDVSVALAAAGAEPEIVHLNRLRARERRWSDYSILVLPGGFSYADALGAGRLLALDLTTYFADEVEAFIAAGKPVLGICNGFQALVKSGILPWGKSLAPGNPAGENAPAGRRITLTHNGNGRFECRRVVLASPSPSPSPGCIWTAGLDRPLYCPVAHGEGRLVADSDATVGSLRSLGMIALVYADASGGPAGGSYPGNPNGSVADIAGLCNATGTVLGLMPHPENNIHPGREAGRPRASFASGLDLFRNGVRFAAGS